MLNNPLQLSSYHILMLRYGSPVVLLETVVNDYFPHMDIKHANRRANAQDLPFPVFKSEPNNKLAKWFVNIADLAVYLDKQCSIAKKDFVAMNG
ncbi:pyocin activator PrtN family protein [Acinetobacter brisouii]|uniref:pyocin activator PrtN family protein n=1 Tax=Acinetobacter brisouii TaxID=396323 RepID=UPI0035AF14B5